MSDKIVNLTGNLEAEKTILAKLNYGIETMEVKQQSDWAETDESSIKFIKNKPSIPDVSELEQKIGYKVQAYTSVYQFPNRGITECLYIDTTNNASYRWDAADSRYICIGRDYNEITIIDGGDAFNG